MKRLRVVVCVVAHAAWMAVGAWHCYRVGFAVLRPGRAAMLVLLEMLAIYLIGVLLPTLTLESLIARNVPFATAKERLNDTASAITYFLLSSVMAMLATSVLQGSHLLSEMRTPALFDWFLIVAVGIVIVTPLQVVRRTSVAYAFVLFSCALIVLGWIKAS